MIYSICALCLYFYDTDRTEQNNVMPNGEENVTNSILEMMHADRHTIGHYRCTADNRVGQPDGRDLFVNVLCKYHIFYPEYMHAALELRCEQYLCSGEVKISSRTNATLYIIIRNRIETNNFLRVTNHQFDVNYSI